jgi:hypothetical protein
VFVSLLGAFGVYGVFGALVLAQAAIAPPPAHIRGFYRRVVEQIAATAEGRAILARMQTERDVYGANQTGDSRHALLLSGLRTLRARLETRAEDASLRDALGQELESALHGQVKSQSEVQQARAHDRHDSRVRPARFDIDERTHAVTIDAGGPNTVAISPGRRHQASLYGEEYTIDGHSIPTTVDIMGYQLRPVFTPDGRHLLAAGAKRGSWREHDTRQGTSREIVLQAELNLTDQWLSPDGSHAAISAFRVGERGEMINYAYLIDRRKFELVPLDHEIESPAFSTSPTGAEWMASTYSTGSLARRIALRDLRTGEEQLIKPDYSMKPVLALGFRDGELLWAQDSGQGLAIRKRVLATGQDEDVGEMAMPNFFMLNRPRVQFSMDGRYLLVRSATAPGFEIHDVKTGQRLHGETPSALEGDWRIVPGGASGTGMLQFIFEDAQTHGKRFINVDLARILEGRQ